MRLSNIAFLYAVRLKSRAVLAQEIFAVIGIAVGVGLLFAAQIASTSLNGSVAAISSGIVGKATFQVEARSPQGFSQSMFARASRLAGVRAAVPVLSSRRCWSGRAGAQTSICSPAHRDMCIWQARCCVTSAAPSSETNRCWH